MADSGRYLRTPQDRVKQILESVPVAICGVTRAEVLHGAKSAAELTELARTLGGFQQAPIAGETWDLLGRNLFLLRTSGITVPFSDALIATVAMQYGYEVWSYDAHFLLMQKALPGLLLFNETA